MKRLMSILLSIVLCFTLLSAAGSTVVQASVEKTIILQEIQKVNEKNAAKYAQDFLATLFTEDNYYTGNIITMYSENDGISGYCIDVFKDELEYGYIVVKFSDNESVISEFCIEKGAKNPYEEIMVSSEITSEEVVFYSVGPNEYHIYDCEKEIVCGLGGERITVGIFDKYKESMAGYKRELEQSLASMSQRNLGNSAVVYSDLNGYTVISDNYEGDRIAGHTISRAEEITYYCSFDVDINDLEYACSVVALSNLMKYYSHIGFDEISTSFPELYNTLWTCAGADSQGSVANGDEPIAAKNYLNALGYSCTYTTYGAELYSDFTRDIGNNRPGIFTYGAMFGNHIGGHAILAVGYITTSSYQYLQVADGWDSYLRYINVNGYDYTRTNAWAFNLSE